MNFFSSPCSLLLLSFRNESGKYHENAVEEAIECLDAVVTLTGGSGNEKVLVIFLLLEFRSES